MFIILLIIFLFHNACIGYALQSLLMYWLSSLKGTVSSNSELYKMMKIQDLTVLMFLALSKAEWLG